MDESISLEGPGMVAVQIEKEEKMGDMPCRNCYSECLMMQLFLENIRVDPGLPYLY